MTEIKVKEICSIAMTEEQGLLVRDTIAPFLSANEPVILDFAGISLFAAMFFNASIGYYIVKKGAEYCTGNIHLRNISPLGNETYQHLFSNAKEIAKTKICIDQFEDNIKIVKANIEES